MRSRTTLTSIASLSEKVCTYPEESNDRVVGTSEYQEDRDGFTNNRQCDLAHNGSSPTLINSKYLTTTTTGSRPLQRCTRNRIISPTSFFTVDRWFESGSNSHSACGLVFIDYMTAYINCEQLRHNPWQAMVANNHD